MTQATTGVARVSAVSHRYASTLALDKVELEIPSGRMVGLIGPDGVGKSTLLGILAGVRRIQTGTVQVLGGDMRNHRHRTALCPRVAYMPQGLGRNLYMTLSVFENIDFFARLFGQQRAEREWRIRELLQATGLAPFAGRAAGKLSGGMKRRMMIARALMHEPRLLILDEPTAALGVKQAGVVLKYILQARNRGIGVIFITHNPHHAYPVADHFVILRRGMVYGDYTKAELPLEQLVQMMAGGADLEVLQHELEAASREGGEEAEAMAETAQAIGEELHELEELGDD